MIGREYKGEGYRVFQTGANNIPTGTRTDVCRIIKKALDIQVSEWNISDEDTKYIANNTYPKPKVNKGIIPSSREVYIARKVTKGLVIGGLDKNINELSMVCPILYESALKGMYNEENGYREVKLRKCTSYQVRKVGKSNIVDYVAGGDPNKNQTGEEKDLIKSMKVWYDSLGLNKYGRFNRGGSIGTPYILFKAKNVIDYRTRVEKWKKCRPIAPAIKHPMNRLMKKVGRAWYFIAKQGYKNGKHFTIPEVQEVPKHIEDMMKELKKEGDEYEVHTYDIEKCFPSMNKDAIKIALTEMIQEHKKEGREGIFVPYSKSKKITWDSPYVSHLGKLIPINNHRIGTWLPWDVLWETMNFILFHSYVKIDKATILEQSEGIPMGMEIAPAMTIGTCAWMEKEWMNTMTEENKRNIVGMRYMDDLFIMSTKRKGKGIIANLEKELYWEPMKLLKTDDNTFLETEYEMTPTGNMKYWLKDTNKGYDKKVWRYHHYDSGLPFFMKKAGVRMCLTKLEKMASDKMVLKNTAKNRLVELMDLGYPKKLLQYHCATMARDTGNSTWLQVRDLMYETHYRPKAGMVIREEGIYPNSQYYTKL